MLLPQKETKSKSLRNQHIKFYSWNIKPSGGWSRWLCKCCSVSVKENLYLDNCQRQRHHQRLQLSHRRRRRHHYHHHGCCYWCFIIIFYLSWFLFFREKLLKHNWLYQVSQQHHQQYSMLLVCLEFCCRFFFMNWRLCGTLTIHKYQNIYIYKCRILGGPT